jgi:hypothetical protein
MHERSAVLLIDEKIGNFNNFREPRMLAVHKYRAVWASIGAHHSGATASAKPASSMGLNGPFRQQENLSLV